jgi:hypothetical protein
MRRILFLLLPALCTLTWCSMTLAGDDKGTEVKLANLKSTTPKNWKAEKINNKLRLHQFAVPKAADDGADGEVVIFFFGEGSGGTVDENVKRWKKMFEAPEGKTIDEAAKVETFKVGKSSITYLDVAGTYLSKKAPLDPNSKVERLANYRMLSIYFDCEGGPYFLRMTGPAKTVEQSKKGFDEWVKNFK